LSRKIVKGMDVIIGQLNTYCFTDSPSQRQFLIDEGVVAADRLEVIGAGSVAGVDLVRFNPERLTKVRGVVRQELQIDPSAVVISYLGRLRADKGINELVCAFQQLQLQSLPVELLLIGPAEFERQPVLPETREVLKTNAHIHVTGYTSAPEKYLSAADLFCFPSYREGFGTSVIEAGAMGLPTVASRIQGCVDSVVDGVTGRLVPAKDAVALAKALHELVTNADLRQQMGQASQVRAMREFDAELINRLVADKYQWVLGLCNRR
jgi:glycosyltransferase involved in cell wall biosynthesis